MNQLYQLYVADNAKRLGTFFHILAILTLISGFIIGWRVGYVATHYMASDYYGNLTWAAIPNDGATFWKLFGIIFFSSCVVAAGFAFYGYVLKVLRLIAIGTNKSH